MTAWAEAHRGQTVVLWALGLALLATLAAVAGGRWSTEAATPGAEGPGAPRHDVIRLAIRAVAIDDPATQNRVESMLGRLLSFDHVADVVPPYSPEGLANISKDRRTAYAEVVLDRPGRDIPAAEAKKMVAQARAASDKDVRFALSGQAIRNAEVVQAAHQLGGAVVLAVVLVAVAFGWTLARGAPAATAVASAVAAVSIVQLLANVVDTPDYAPVVAGIVGLCLGLEGGLAAARQRGRSAAAASGAPLAAVVALIGMVLVDLPFVPAVAFGAAAAVLVAVLASTTLVPALLGRPSGRRAGGPPGGPALPAGSWSPPRPPTAVAVAALVALAVPILFARLGVPGGTTQPATASSRQAYDVLAKGFGPGYASPLVVSVDHRDAVAPLAQRLRSVPGVAAVAALPVPATDAGGALAVTPTTGANAKATGRLVDRLQADNGVHVGGLTAEAVEAGDTVRTRMPLLIGLTIGLLFLVRLALSHSPAGALRAAGTKLLAVLAAYGALVAVAQGALGQSVVFYPLPVIVLAVLIASTGDRRSLLIVPVFLALALSGEPVLRQAGLGLALAVLIDAAVMWLLRTPRPPSGGAGSPPSRAPGRSPARPTARR